jgi:hypothetical protein
MPPSAGADPDHDAILDQALRAAGVPPQYLEPHHLVGAATLMAKQDLAPAEAYERFVMQSVPDLGLIDPARWQDLYGFGVGSDVQPASTLQDERALMGSARKGGLIDPAKLQNLDGFGAGGEVLPGSALQDGTLEQRDFKGWPVTQAPTNEGWQIVPSDSGSPRFDPALMPAAGRPPKPGSRPGRVPDILGPFFPPQQQPPEQPKQPPPPQQQLPPPLPPPQPAPQSGTEAPSSPALDRPRPTHPGFDAANLRDKLHGYLLEPDNLQNQGKAIWFQKALGFDKNTWQQLAPQLYFDESTAVFRETTPYGDRYSQFIRVTGPNGRTIVVEFIFQKDGAGRVAFITGIPTDK